MKTQIEKSEKPRKRFDPVAHAKWQAKVFGKGKVMRLVDKYLMADRETRFV